MNKERLFAFLKQQEKQVLLNLLETTFEAMSIEKREKVSYKLYQQIPMVSLMVRIYYLKSVLSIKTHL